MEKDIHTPPQSMNITVMRQLMDRLIHDDSKFFTAQDFAIGNNVDFFGKLMNMTDGGPFFLEDYRLGMVVQGEGDITVNLLQHHMTAGELLFIGQGSIVHLNHISGDVILKGFILSPDLVSQLFGNDAPALLANTATAFHCPSSAQDREFICDLQQTLWQLVHREAYPVPVAHALLSALLLYYDRLYANLQNLPANSSNNHRLFKQFIALVNQFSDTERSIPFYAGKLCLSPRYFSTLIQEQSGNSAKYWIDTAVITKAKILLRHSDKTISQITDELHFPNDSFFCKYFRRLTGASPTEYRDRRI